MSKPKFPKTIAIPLDLAKSVSGTITEAYPGIKLEKYTINVVANIIQMSKKVKEKDYTKVLLNSIKKYIENTDENIDLYSIEQIYADKFSIESAWVDDFADYMLSDDETSVFTWIEMVGVYDDLTTITISLKFHGADVTIPIIRITNAKAIPPCISLLSVIGESTIHSSWAISGDFETLI